MSGLLTRIVPLSRQTAHHVVQSAEDLWNTRDPRRVAMSFSSDTIWRDRSCAAVGRLQVLERLVGKWERERDYALRLRLWTAGGNRLSLRSQYEFCDDHGQWWRCMGAELWEFNQDGLVQRCETSVNDLPISEADRRIFGPRPGCQFDLEFPIF